MAETKTLAAAVRGGTGKGAARSVRREGRVPAVIYGGGEAPEPISLSYNEVNKLIYAGHFLTTTFELDIGGRKERVIPRDYQLDVVKDRPLHVDFLRLKAGSRLKIEIPVRFVGQEESPGLKEGGSINVVRHAIELWVPGEAIPEAIEIDVSKLTIGDTIHISDIRLPLRTKLTVTGRDMAIASIAPPMQEETFEDEVEGIEGVEGEATAEGEGAAEGEGEAKEGAEDAKPEAEKDK